MKAGIIIAIALALLYCGLWIGILLERYWHEKYKVKRINNSYLESTRKDILKSVNDN